MPKSSKLKEYNKKRNFSKTKEPQSNSLNGNVKLRRKEGKVKLKREVGKVKLSREVERQETAGVLRFVVQKHNATRLHYDFRLEINKVLVSWAIPKEPSQNEREKRLAVQTEDHPLEYAKFEGTIPKGNYGAGTVEIWDKGKFENIRKNNVSMKKALEQGQIEINLNGKKLKGKFALIKLKPTEKYPNKNNWLFFKMKE